MSDEKRGIFGKLANAAQDFRNRRQHERNFDTAQLTVRFDKVKYNTLDWSIGGFRINMPNTTVKKGDVLEGDIVSGIRRVKDKTISARAARVNDNDDVGFQLTEISHEAFAALNELQMKD